MVRASMRKYEKVSESTRKYDQVWERMSKYDKLRESTKKYEHVWASMRRYVNPWSSTRKCEKVSESESMGKYWKVWESMRRYEEVSESVRTYEKAKESTRKFENVCGSARKLRWLQALISRTFSNSVSRSYFKQQMSLNTLFKRFVKISFRKSKRPLELILMIRLKSVLGVDFRKKSGRIREFKKVMEIWACSHLSRSCP